MLSFCLSHLKGLISVRILPQSNCTGTGMLSQMRLVSECSINCKPIHTSRLSPPMAKASMRICTVSHDKITIFTQIVRIAVKMEDEVCHYIVIWLKCHHILNVNKIIRDEMASLYMYSVSECPRGRST